MKTYIHPVIKLPAGDVQVKFYDPSKDGTENMPDLIKEIGDVEEGFDINLGELWVPSCVFIFANINNYVNSVLFDTESLLVSVTVGGEYYFYGDIDMGSFDPDLLEISNEKVYGTISITALSAIQRLKNYSYTKFYVDLLMIDFTDPNGYVNFDNIFFLLTNFIRLNPTETNVSEYHFLRRFSNIFHESEDPMFYTILPYVLLKKEFFQSKAGNNYYYNRIKNAFQLISELAREYFFYPSIISHEDDFALCFTERDFGREVTVNNVKGTVPTMKYTLNSLSISLANKPDDFLPEGFDFKVSATHPNPGEDINIEMHEAFYENIKYEDYSVNMYPQLWKWNYLGVKIYPIVNRIYNMKGGIFTPYDTFQQAIGEAYKGIYFDHRKWRKITIRGLNATYDGVSSQKNLMPTMRFSFLNEMHYIHSVNKSLMKNESEILALRLV